MAGAIPNNRTMADAVPNNRTMADAVPNNRTMAGAVPNNSLRRNMKKRGTSKCNLQFQNQWNGMVEWNTGMTFDPPK